jgi:hypothetical protein
MNTILVWVLIMNSNSGGMIMYDNIANLDDCERLRKRAEQAATRSSDGYKYVTGSCTQINKIVIAQPAPTINVQPSPPAAVTIQNRVIVRKPQP